MVNQTAISQCCPEFYKGTRCDKSCFVDESAVAYFPTTPFAGHSRTFVQAGFDDCDPNGTSGDKLCWSVDTSVTVQTIPLNALKFTGISSSDIFATEDEILTASATQDNELYVIVCLCKKDDYNQMLTGGTSSTKVDTANNLQALKNKYNGAGNNHANRCAKEQYFALNVIGANINGTTYAHNTAAGGGLGAAKDPLTVGDYVTISGSIVDVNGASASVLKTVTGPNDVGGGTTSGVYGGNLTEDIFRVIDRTKQIKPDCSTILTSYDSRVKYPFPVDGYIANPVIKTHDNVGGNYSKLENCSSCLQAYLAFVEGDASANTKGLGDIIDITDSTYNKILIDNPSTWPCTVQISRTFSLDATKAQNNSLDTSDISRPLLYSELDTPRTDGTIVCGNEEDRNDFTLLDTSLGLADPTFRNSVEGHYMTKNIFEFDRSIRKHNPNDASDDGTIINEAPSISTITFNCEYQRTARIDATDSGCGSSSGNIIALRPSENAEAAEYDYQLKSVSVALDNEPVNGTIIPAMFDDQADILDDGITIPDIVHGIHDAQPTFCTLVESTSLRGTQKWTRELNKPIVAKRGGKSLTDPDIGYSSDRKTYRGKIFIQRPNGAITPFYKYVGYYSSHLENGDQYNSSYEHVLPENDTTKFTDREREMFAADGDLAGRAIDEVIPFAPSFEIPAGFNLHGFTADNQKTQPATDNDNNPDGRPDGRSITVDGVAKYVFPGYANTSKITTDQRILDTSDGTQLTGLNFFFDSYLSAIGSMQTCSKQQTLTEYSRAVSNAPEPNDSRFVNPPYGADGGPSSFDNCFDFEIFDNSDPNNPIGVQFNYSPDENGLAPEFEYCSSTSPQYCRKFYSWPGNAINNPDPGDRNGSFGYFPTFPYNNPFSRINGSTTGNATTFGGADVTGDDVVDQGTGNVILYEGNGKKYQNSGLSGDSIEAVRIDSEWLNLWVEAKDPWCQACEGCLSQVSPNSTSSPFNYQMLGIPAQRKKDETSMS